MSASNLCNHFKFGYCRYGTTCRYQHVNIICEKRACEIFNCNYRHQKDCKYWKEFGKCKFNDYCSYKHETRVDGTRNEIEVLKKEVTELKDCLEENKLELEAMRYQLNSFIMSTKINLSNESAVMRSDIFEPSNDDTRKCITVLANVPQEHSAIDTIPQLDGNSAIHEQATSLACANCSTSFRTQHELDQHSSVMEFGCEDCGLCLKTELDTDLHEYEIHREDYFKYNSLTPRSKHEAIKRLRLQDMKS